ncbi:hypothetical protein C8R44DRAFT_749754 [Mycena epipterygia]|nr:hypothetical protein C8R44DRAFT_749754 [Mycena epipterygia]
MNFVAIVTLLIPAVSAFIANSLTAPTQPPASRNARGAGSAEILPRMCELASTGSWGHDLATVPWYEMAGQYIREVRVLRAVVRRNQDPREAKQVAMFGKHNNWKHQSRMG